MGWDVLLLISPRQFSSSSSSRTVLSCLCVLQRVVLGCADVTCTAAIADRVIASCWSPLGRQLSHLGGCAAHFPHQHEHFSLRSPSRPCLVPRPCQPPARQPGSVIDAEKQIAQLPGAQDFQGENSGQPEFALRAVSNHLGYSKSIFSCWLGFFFN